MALAYPFEEGDQGTATLHHLPIRQLELVTDGSLARKAEFLEDEARSPVPLTLVPLRKSETKDEPAESADEVTTPSAEGGLAMDVSKMALLNGGFAFGGVAPLAVLTL